MDKLGVFIPLNRNIYPFGDKIKRLMSNPVIIKNKPKIAPISLNWQDNPDIQGLLDIVVSIIADEYIETARNNEGVFSALETENTFTGKEIASASTGSRNDREGK